MSAVLKVLSAGAAQGITLSFAETLKQATGCTLDAEFSAVGAMRDRFVSGEACDLVILTAKQVAELAAAGKVLKDAGGSLGEVRTGLAVRTGDPRPPIHDGPSLAAALRGAEEIHHADPTKATAGIHFVGVIERLGLTAEIAKQMRPHPRGHVAMHALAQSKARTALGCTQISEIADTPGIEVLGELPPEYGLATAYAVAVSAKSHAPDLARWLANALAGEGSKEARRARGFVV
jgi:molybdate transport system substrate-binding protein